MTILSKVSLRGTRKLVRFQSHHYGGSSHGSKLKVDSSLRFSSTLSMSLLDGRKREEDKRRATAVQKHNQHQQERKFLVPAVGVGVLLALGWVAYRKSQGKPVASDKALSAQEAYKKGMEEIQQRNKEHASQMQKVKMGKDVEESSKEGKK